MKQNLYDSTYDVFPNRQIECLSKSEIIQHYETQSNRTQFSRGQVSSHLNQIDDSNTNGKYVIISLAPFNATLKEESILTAATDSIPINPQSISKKQKVEEHLNWPRKGMDELKKEIEKSVVQIHLNHVRQNFLEEEKRKEDEKKKENKSKEKESFIDQRKKSNASKGSTDISHNSFKLPFVTDGNKRRKSKHDSHNFLQSEHSNNRSNSNRNKNSRIINENENKINKCKVDQKLKPILQSALESSDSLHSKKIGNIAPLISTKSHVVPDFFENSVEDNEKYWQDAVQNEIQYYYPPQMKYFQKIKKNIKEKEKDDSINNQSRYTKNIRVRSLVNSLHENGEKKEEGSSKQQNKAQSFEIDFQQVSEQNIRNTSSLQDNYCSNEINHNSCDVTIEVDKQQQSDKCILTSQISLNTNNGYLLSSNQSQLLPKYRTKRQVRTNFQLKSQISKKDRSNKEVIQLNQIQNQSNCLFEIKSQTKIQSKGDNLDKQFANLMTKLDVPPAIQQIQRIIQHPPKLQNSQTVKQVRFLTLTSSELP